MPKAIDETGNIYGLWRVLERVTVPVSHHAEWLCLCTGCGARQKLRGCDLRGGGSRACQTCACLRHGHCAGGYRSPEYAAFSNARGRCQNARDASYANYGGRGIEFRFASFQEFFAEVGPRPPGLTLDRLNNDGHYEKGNVAWRTRSEQRRNRRPRSRWSRPSVGVGYGFQVATTSESSLSCRDFTQGL
jgi:hypothetical protein